MAATITLRAPRTTTVQVPAEIGHKTITMNVDYVGCHVSISRTNTQYYAISGRRDAFRGTPEAYASVWFDQVQGLWVGDYYDQEFGSTEIGRTRTLPEMLLAASRNVSWRGHANGAW